MAQKSEGLIEHPKTVIYCRVSTYDQSCERQENELKVYADKCGYDVLEIYKETGSGAKLDRVMRKKAIAMARARSIDVILVSEMTRWGRSTVDLINSLNELQSWGVSLIAQNGFQLDMGTPHGRMVAAIMASMAEFERDLLRERVNSGLAAAKARGQTLGRPRGGKTERLSPKIRILRGQGKSMRQIAAELKISVGAVSAVINQSSAESTRLQGDQVSLDV